MSFSTINPSHEKVSHNLRTFLRQKCKQTRINIYCISEWKRYLRRAPQRWVWHYVSWMKFAKEKMYILQYDKLMTDFHHEIETLLNFLKYPSNESLLNCLHKHVQDILEKDNFDNALINDILFDKNTRLTLSMYEKVLEKSSKR